MADPILDAHRLLPQLYLLGSPLTPISIRDQMLRARWLIDRLAAHRQLPNDSMVLVVGAGAAGATAATRAVQHGARALLVEQSDGAFGVQARSDTRWIDPAQYDWPAGHWATQVYPNRPPLMPFGFRAAYASRLARQWDTLLHRHIAIHRPQLSFQRNLPDHVAEQIRVALRAGNKIEAILIFRDHSQVGLAEAKEFVERFETGSAGGSTKPARASAAPPSQIEAQIRQAIAGGRKIEAIKHYRDWSKVGLKEAKENVERIAAAPNSGSLVDFSPAPSPPTASGCLSIVMMSMMGVFTVIALWAAWS